MATFTMPPFTGGPEDDVFRPTEERDSIRGGGGMDTVDYSAGDEGVEVNLTSGRGLFGLAAGDAYSSVENAVGTVFNDWLIGRSGANTLRGGAGDDNLYGYAGDDVLMGGDGDDTLGRREDGPDDDSDPDLVDDAGDDTMMGNAGNDMLYGGPGADRLMGGRDDDMVRGNAGDDMLWGGAGNDMIYGGMGNDTAWGGAGADTIVGGGDTDADGADTDAAGVDRLWGNAGTDTLLGGAGNDMLGGGRDDDLVRGQAGDDTLWGGAGDDTVYGGPGMDMVEGGAGADRLYGGSVDTQGMHVADTYPPDVPRAMAAAHNAGTMLLPNSMFLGNTVVYAGSDEAVTIDLGKDADATTEGMQQTAAGGHAEGDVLMDFQGIRGSAHDDTLTGDGRANFIRGHRGDDVIKGGGNEAVTLLYPDSDPDDADDDSFSAVVNVMDVLWGGAGDDDIDGQDGPDDIMGGPGDDDIKGGDGDDMLYGGAGTDTIDGGAGTDTLSFASATEGVTVDLPGDEEDGYRVVDGDRVKGVERVMGSNFDDMITGKVAGWTLMGGAGDDTIVTNASTTAANSLVGGPGNDTYVISPTSTTGAFATNSIMEAAGAAGGADTIRFSGEDEDGDAQGAGVFGVNNWVILPDNVENAEAMGNVRDFINGNALPNMISGGAGNDIINGGNETDADGGQAPGDTIVLGGGDDEANGNAGHDTIDGGTGDDVLRGQEGRDTLNGGAGDDEITGGDGNDTVDGGAGEDTITVGLGDTITGGAGKDSFVVTLEPGDNATHTTITFTDLSGRETIDLAAHVNINVANMRTALDNATESGGNVRIVLPAANTSHSDDITLVIQGRTLDSLDASATAAESPEFLTDA